MSSQFFTNRDNNNLLTKFKGVLEHIPNLHSFDALVGYFRSTGYFRLRPFLENIQQIRIWVGINVGQLSAQYKARKGLYKKLPKMIDTFFKNKKVSDLELVIYKRYK